MTGLTPTGRRRVLISAYACGPGDESEASAGWAIVCAAAQQHDVWLITRNRFRDGIEAELARDPLLGQHVTVHYLDLGARVLRYKRRGIDVYWYYALWQRRLRAEVRSLHDTVGFEVAHHVTFAADWLPCGLATLQSVPLVWGPVGGATYLPPSMWRWVGVRGAAGELLRSLFTRGCRRIWGDAAARRAELVVAQNGQVARRFRTARRVIVEPNAALAAMPASRRTPDAPARRAIFVARLVAWKGARLAVSALAEPVLAGWTLDVYGSGRDESAVRRLAAQLSVANRITFHGQTARAEVLDAMTRADVLLFPSLHDSAGWAVAEASAAGCPVVCFDHGGPPLLAGPNAHVVATGPNAVRDLAVAVDQAARLAVSPYDRWRADRLTAVVGGWYATAGGDEAAD